MSDHSKNPPVQLQFSLLSEEEAADRYALGLMSDRELDAHVDVERAGVIRRRASAWRRNHKFTPDVRQKFLEALELTGNVSVSAFRAGVSREAAYHLRDRDEEFREEFDRAREAAGDVLEAEAFRRAVRGTEKPVYYQGRPCGVVVEYSDSLLKTLLTASRPWKFSERLIQSTSDVPPEELDRLIEEEMARGTGDPSADPEGESNG